MSPEPLTCRALMLVGPTAVGKTSLALEVAERAGAEILSCDSRQLYRGLTVGTAKPTPDECTRVQHHLVDVADPREAWSAGRFAREARAVLSDLARRDVPALITGGSGLYLRALRRGLAELPSDPDVRRTLREECRQLGAPALHERLRAVDPVAAAGMHPNNRERVVRALEVWTITGRPMSELWAESGAEAGGGGRAADPSRSSDGGAPGAWGHAAFPADVVGVDRDRAELHDRIDRRVVAMFDAGLLDEVRGLLARGFDASWPAYRTLGYPEAVRAVRGESSTAEAIQEIQTKTRRFARRQLTWFRREPGIEWVVLGEGDGAAIASGLADRLRHGDPVPLD